MIAVIEDSEAVAEVTARLLRELGFEASVAPDADGLRSLLADGGVAGIILDWELPKRGALEALTALVELPSSKRPVTILTMTEFSEDQFALAKAAGARHSVIKPYDKADLAAALTKTGLLEESAG